MDNIKCISYGSMVGLLVEAIKQLNDKVSKLENTFLVSFYNYLFKIG